MSRWAKIGCAVDFSESSRAALVEAADLAKRCGAELLLIHVSETPEAALDMPTPEAGRAGQLELERKLEGWRAEAARLSGGEVSSEVAVGPAADEIARLARDRGADLVVCGSHGRRGLRRLAVGSVAERLVRVAPCPVLVVRRGS